jgi:pyruvate/2-oxoglutarate dehydrogenase complex dihydrolipoamide dehydrogenase (E3) component
MNPMNAPEKYDVLVLGGGTAGKLAAWTMAKEGRRTAVVDRRYIGGSCPNVACLPSKNVIHSAKVASLVRRHREFGIETGPIAIDMAGVYARKRDMVDGIIQVHLDKYRAALDKYRGDELIFGDGTFVGPRTLHVALRDGSERTLTADRVFVNLGSRATIPDTPGLREAKPLTHIEALDLQRRPDHLIVLGGGYVGLELSQALRRLGSRVTLISRDPRLASQEDADVSQAILQLFQDEGIDVMLNTHVLGVSGISGEHVSLQLQTSEGPRTVEGSDILVALGRTPNTSGIGLGKAGIEVTQNGHIRVNDRLETTASNVWAMGDCAGSPYFTHVSEDDFAIIHENLNGGQRSTRDRLVPSCVFIDPELARVGLNESQARERGVAYHVASVPVDSGWRPWTISEKRGFMKVLIDANSDRILGFTGFGPEAGELMGTVQLAMLAGLPYTILRDIMFAHPTMTEGLKTLFMSVPQRLENHAEQLQHARTSAD